MRRCAVTGTSAEPGQPLALLLVILVCLGNVVSRSAGAQGLPEQEVEQGSLVPPTSSGSWSGALGLGIGSGPPYPGARSERATPLPLISFRYRSKYFIGTSGIGMDTLSWKGLKVGPVIGFEGGTRQRFASRPAGLGDIQPSVTAGIFATYKLGSLSLNATVRQAVVHTSNGAIGRLQFDYRHVIIPQKLELTIGPEVDLGDGAFERTWFGVSLIQSERSGLTIFVPRGGFTDAGAHFNLDYQLSRHILLLAFGDARETSSHLASSRIVQNRTQVFFGVGFTYLWGADEGSTFRPRGVD